MKLHVYINKYRKVRRLRFRPGGHYLLVGPYWLRYVERANYNVSSYFIR